MTTQLKAWENGQGVRFSKELLGTVGIHLNDYLDINVVDGNIILSKSFKHKTLEERAAEYDNKTGPYEEMDWREPHGREEW